MSEHVSSADLRTSLVRRIREIGYDSDLPSNALEYKSDVRFKPWVDGSLRYAAGQTKALGDRFFQLEWGEVEELGFSNLASVAQHSYFSVLVNYWHGANWDEHENRIASDRRLIRNALLAVRTGPAAADRVNCVPAGKVWPAPLRNQNASLLVMPFRAGPLHQPSMGGT